MDEEINIINQNNRNEKIKNFFIKNKKILISLLLLIITIFISFFIFEEIKKRNTNKLAIKFNSTVIDFKIKKKENIVSELNYIINKKDKTYSPLALYFLIDNNLSDNKEDINNFFDILILKTGLEFEVKNLIIYKKALYNSDILSENELLKMLNPIINSKSIWKSHALFLMAEYFYSKEEKKKAKEFFNEILILSNSNEDIKLESQKRLNRDLGE